MTPKCPVLDMHNG